MINLKLPTPKQIKKARENAKLTQLAAAELVGMSHKTWQNWESETGEHRQMGLWYWKTFLEKTGQLEKRLKGNPPKINGNSIAAIAKAVEGMKMNSAYPFDIGYNAACDDIVKMLADKIATAILENSNG